LGGRLRTTADYGDADGDGDGLGLSVGLGEGGSVGITVGLGVGVAVSVGLGKRLGETLASVGLGGTGDGGNADPRRWMIVSAA
jgi:hypothetical protein